MLDGLSRPVISGGHDDPKLLAVVDRKPTSAAPAR
jgi:hypothetical protein